MTLKLYYHPLSSFCMKALIALYECGAPFEPVIVNLGGEADAAAFRKIWPIGKFPVLRDDARDRTVPEATIIIEYLAEHYPGKSALIFEDEDRALQTRLTDRFYDLYVQVPMQKIVGDRIRPAGKQDPHGVAEARTLLATSLAMIEKDMEDKTWAMGGEFTMADCAAAPALYYADKVSPFGLAQKNTRAYFDRLRAHPSFARVLKEAEPYSHLFPQERN